MKLTPVCFRRSLTEGTPPEGVAGPLLALWHEARGDWELAHGIVQEDSSTKAARVHAYLHRREGDPANARYWYHRAGVDPAEGSLQAEWMDIVTRLLSDNV